MPLLEKKSLNFFVVYNESTIFAARKSRNNFKNYIRDEKGHTS